MESAITRNVLVQSVYTSNQQLSRRTFFFFFFKRMRIICRLGEDEFDGRRDSKCRLKGDFSEFSSGSLGNSRSCDPCNARDCLPHPTNQRQMGHLLVRESSAKGSRTLWESKRPLRCSGRSLGTTLDRADSLFLTGRRDMLCQYGRKP